MSQNIGQGEDITSSSTRRSEKISRDILGRFLVPVLQVFEEKPENVASGSHAGFKLLINDLKVNGIESLDKPDEFDDSEPKFRPYRRFLKVLSVYAWEMGDQAGRGGSNSETRQSFLSNDKYSVQQLALLEG